jgi:phosphatidylserine decarboxylase
MKVGGVGARLFVGLQYCLPQRLLSRGVWWLTRSTLLKRPLIAVFMRGFKPAMHDAVQSDAQAYRTFNDFFTRALRADARPLPDDTAALACPVDGTVSSFGAIEDGQLWQAKGQNYSLLALLAGDAVQTARYRHGSFITIYLAPYNYHRIHMPLGGELRAAAYVPGALFSVNDVTAAHVPGLFARNERVVCHFEQDGQPFTLILVGALFVGSMTTVWHGDIAPTNGRVVTSLHAPATAAPLQIARSAELGRFNMGSTVILLFPSNSVALADDLYVGRVVRMGEAIGRQLPSGTAQRATGS